LRFDMGGDAHVEPTCGAPQRDPSRRSGRSG
jgi:hypothetical protein